MNRLHLIWEPRDVWIGVYIGPHAVFAAFLPCVVFRWDRPITRTEAP